MRLIFLSFFAAVSLLLGASKSQDKPPGSKLTADPDLPAITLEQISRTDHTWTATLSAERTFTLLATGDILLARTINSRNVARKDFTFPFIPTRDLLSSADATFINLETPLLPGCPISTSGTVFCGDPQNVKGLLFAGIDVASIANNHSYDYLEPGFASTRKILTDNNIGAVSPGHPYQTKIKNVRVSYHAFNDIWSRSKDYSKVDEKNMSAELRAARETSDLVIVMFHWGNEYTKKVTDRQKSLAHLAIDSGADLVIGNHPHWPQGSEIYQGKLISYSQGNFIFDQYWSPETMAGQLAKYTFYDTKLVDAEYIPVLMQTNGQTIKKVIQ
jgi:poly-gamma-glutamate synthesis protein (capsule biosynthesis protein)